MFAKTDGFPTFENTRFARAIVVLLGLTFLGLGCGTKHTMAPLSYSDTNDSDAEICECGPHATCIDQQCVCDEGYENDGSECVPVVTACTDISCWGHGVCELDENGDPRCICNPGYHLEGLYGCVADDIVGYSDVCNEHGLCWENPYPQGNPLLAMWAFSANDVWAAGAGGTIIHWDGYNWSGSMEMLQGNQALSSHCTLEFREMWGSDPDNLWVAGYRRLNHETYVELRHWDGNTWSQVQLPHAQNPNRVSAIFGFGRDDLWIADNFSLWRYHQGQWIEPDPDAPHFIEDLWGTSPDDLWAVTGHGTIHRWDGEVWSMEFSSGGALRSIWGTRSDDIWAVGDNGMAAHFDGIEWTEVDVGRNTQLLDIWGSAEDNYWIITHWFEEDFGSREEILHWNGAEWEPYQIEDDPWPMVALHGVDFGDVWMVSERGGIQRWNGSEWVRLDRGPVENLRDMWPGGHNSDIWVIGEYGVVARRTEHGWEQIETPAEDYLTMVFAPSYDEVWIDGWGSNLLRLSDSGELLSEHPFDGYIHDIWTAGDHIWVASDNLYEWDGEEFQVLPCDECTRTHVSMIEGTGVDNVFAIDNETGDTRHFDGENWSHLPGLDPRSSYEYLSCVPDETCFLVENRSQILRWNGTGWIPLEEPHSYIEEMWAGSDDFLWIIDESVRSCVGNHSDLMYWDGTEWNEIIKIAGSNSDVHLSGSATGEVRGVWVYGTFGSILRQPF